MPSFSPASAEALLPGPVGFVLFPRFAMMALASAIEPLRIANRYLQTPYVWKLLSLDGGAVTDDNGISIQTHGSIHDVQTLGSVILCADMQPERHYSRDLRQWLQRKNAEGVSLGALDTGGFLLARAGLLDGCRATVHWEVVEAFRERFPKVVVAQTLFEIDSRRLTCAGGTAAIDMMLSAVAIDHGIDLANRVAEHCLHDRIRPGDVTQRMALTTRSRIHHPAVATAMQLLESTPERAIDVPELANHVGLSTRQLLRLFSQIVGEGPSRYHRRLRLEHARSLLRHTTITVTEVSVAAGFESLANFSRAYRQQYGRSPAADRSRESKGQPLLRDRA